MFRLTLFCVIGILSGTVGALVELKSSRSDAASMVLAAEAEKSPQVSALTRSARATLTNLCMTCHRAAESHDQQMVGLAPPMWGVRDHYLKHHPEQDAFVAALTQYVQKPNADRSLMKGAVDRFGVMMTLGLPEEQVAEIAKLIYQGELITEPSWWEAHQQEEAAAKGH
jgi:hypothetical protein